MSPSLNSKVSEQSSYLLVSLDAKVVIFFKSALLCKPQPFDFAYFEKDFAYSENGVTYSVIQFHPFAKFAHFYRVSIPDQKGRIIWPRRQNNLVKKVKQPGQEAASAARPRILLFSCHKNRFFIGQNYIMLRFSYHCFFFSRVFLLQMTYLCRRIIKITNNSNSIIQ